MFFWRLKVIFKRPWLAQLSDMDSEHSGPYLNVLPAKVSVVVVWFVLFISHCAVVLVPRLFFTLCALGPFCIFYLKKESVGSILVFVQYCGPTECWKTKPALSNISLFVHFHSTFIYHLELFSTKGNNTRHILAPTSNNDLCIYIYRFYIFI